MPARSLLERLCRVDDTCYQVPSPLETQRATFTALGSSLYKGIK
ncbi:hypothetical protein ACFSF3_15305 [Vibrio chagasii]